MNLFSGSALFELKATHGLPLDIALDLLKAKGKTVTWVDFIEQARKGGWFDWTTYREIEYALRDTEFPGADRILELTRYYMMRNPQYA